MTGGISDLGLDPATASAWFDVEQSEPWLRARLTVVEDELIAGGFALAIRRCYIADDVLIARVGATGSTVGDLIAAKLPDAGSTMSGDFGEILAYLFLSTSQLPGEAIGPLKWRLKQDRTKPAPHSDVLLFLVPNWPHASDADTLICAEVKTKATPGSSAPIEDALRDSGRDRTSRLARTLQWLRERALVEEIAGASLELLDRFAFASDHPPSVHEFVATAILSESLSDDEISLVPAQLPPNQRLVVVSVPELQALYTALFAAAAVPE